VSILSLLQLAAATTNERTNDEEERMPLLPIDIQGRVSIPDVKDMVHRGFVIVGHGDGDGGVLVSLLRAVGSQSGIES
jgi:hypothetical protein